MNTIDIVGRAVGQYRKSQSNLQAISQARQKMEKEQELYDLKKQKAKLDLEQAELTGLVKSHQYKFLDSQMKEYFKQQESISDGKLAMIDQEEDKQSILSDRSAALARSVINTPRFRDEIGLLEPVVSASQGGVVGFKRREAKDPAKTTGGISQKDVIEEARRLADEDDSDMPRIDKIKKYLPDARQMLSGEDTSEAEPVKVKPSTDQGNSTKVKVKAPDGRVGYIPKENVEKAKQRGYSVL